MPSKRLVAVILGSATVLLVAAGAQAASRQLLRSASDTEKPSVSAISATFDRPVTSYSVTAFDADGDTLSYTWTKQQATPCGAFSAGNSSTATWSHPDKDFDPPGDCPAEAIHPAVITVVVKDGNGWICTASYAAGSAAGDGDAADCVKAKPHATVTPPTLTFSTHRLNRTSDPQTVTLTNTGEPDSVLSVSSAEVFMSTNAGALAASANKCNSVELRVGESCTIQVTFTANHNGDYSGIVIFVDDDPDSATQTAQLTATALPGGTGGGSSSGHTFGEGTKTVLKGIDKSANNAGNAIAVLAAINAVVPEPFLTKGFALGLAVTAAVLKLGGSICGYLAETVDPPDAAFRRVVVAKARHVPKAHAGPGISPALAAAENALAANGVALEANVHAYWTAVDRATGAAKAGKAKAAKTQRRAAAGFADKAAAELLADVKLRAAVAKLLRGIRFTVNSADVARAHATIAARGLPASVASVLRAFGVGPAELKRIAKGPAPTHISLAVMTGASWTKADVAAAKALRASAKKLRSS